MSSAAQPDPRRTSWRVGDRVELSAGVEVAWRLEPGTSHRSRRHLGRQRRPESAVVMDVSDGGAGIIVAAAAHDVGVGSDVVIGLGDARATVRVVRMEAMPDGRRRYGVQFLRVGAGFRQALLRHRCELPAAPGRPLGGTSGGAT